MFCVMRKVWQKFKGSYNAVSSEKTVKFTIAGIKESLGGFQSFQAFQDLFFRCFFEDCFHNHYYYMYTDTAKYIVKVIFLGDGTYTSQELTNQV